uniref:Uncharacterized protein n=1 Tax=Rhabditophanes sp. KR3021 TaxID=114890 RepID=A0AC35UD13_9BILA
MPDKPVILNGSNKKATSTISKVKALPIFDKNIQPQLHSPKPLFSSAFNLRPDHFSIANNEEDDDEVVSLSPASEPDLSGSDRKTSFFTEQLKLYPHFQYHKKPAPELDSQVKVHQAGEFAVPQNPFLNQQTLPAYRFHESPSITQLMSDDRSLLLQNDTEQIKAMEKCEEEVSCENRVNLDCLK